MQGAALPKPLHQPRPLGLGVKACLPRTHARRARAVRTLATEGTSNSADVVSVANSAADVATAEIDAPAASDATVAGSVASDDVAISSDTLPADVAGRSASTRRGPDTTVVVGGGPAGLAAAIMLARRGWTGIRVWEKRGPPAAPEASEWSNPERSYNLGISSRGQIVLNSLGVLPRIENWAAVVRGRKDWTPENPEGKERLPSNRATTSYLTKTIQRDRLTACLIEEIQECYADAISLEWFSECTSVEWEGDQVHVGHAAHGKQVGTVTADLLIGADGVNGGVARAMSARSGSGVNIVNMKERDGSELVFKTIRIDLPDSMRSDLNYSVRLPSGITLEMLPTKEGTLIGVLLHKPGEPEIEALDTAHKAEDYFKANFPQFSPHVTPGEYALFAHRTASRLPKFQYVGPNISAGGNAVLLGDAIHTVKPYFGLGVNAAFEDVAFLERSLDAKGNEDDTDLAPVLQQYSDERAKDAKAVVELSHTLDGGFMKFVFPLILDGMFHKLAPTIFYPNTIQMLQREQWTFDRVRRRKRLDRILQAACILPILSTIAAAMFIAIRFVVAKLWAWAGPRMMGGMAM